MNSEKDPRIELTNRGYSQQQIESVLKSKTNSTISSGLKFTKPTWHFEYSKLSYVLNLFENYERGVLPFNGSVSEQPAQIIEIFNLLASLKQDQKRKLEQARK